MRHKTGFTLIELMVVLTLLSILVSLAAPVVTRAIGQARESVLKENLFVMRKAIDDFYADHGMYPETLLQLAEKRYIRKIPVDPLTEKDMTWEVVFTDDGSGIVDIHSGAPGVGSNGNAYNTW